MKKITKEELELLVGYINGKMKKYDEDIKGRMEHSDRVELDMLRVSPRFLNQKKLLVKMLE